MAQGKALMAAEVAACIRFVNGSPLRTSLHRDEAAEVYVREQFEYIVTKWQWPVVEVVHNFWKQLQVRQAEALMEFKGK
jgi:CMP-N-acetylneuraminic acid synthetase